MAVSAFRSTSKRGNFIGPSSSGSASASSSAKEYRHEDPGRRNQPRRSRSVSAVARHGSEVSSRQPAMLGFSNKRDNPLFNASSSSPTDSEKSGGAADVKDDDPGRRGRSVSRGMGSAGGGQWASGRKGIGRSLSRVDTGRRQRSLSRARSGKFESDMEKEQECSLASTLRSKMSNGCASNGQKISDVTDEEFALLSSQIENARACSTQYRVSEPWARSPDEKQEDGTHAGYFSLDDEKTIDLFCEHIQNDHPLGDAGDGGIYETVRSEVRRAVSEIRNDLVDVIQQNNPSIISAADVVDISYKLVTPKAVELIADIRREYAVKLEQSQDRARKLRADLEAEEQHVQELSRILKKLFSDPKISETQKARTRRKSSIERRRMSKRLTDEAMNYFDECVSISTFDSSDFSSHEDPSSGSAVTLPNNVYSLAGDSSTHLSRDNICHNKESDDQTLCSLSYPGSTLTCNSSFSSTHYNEHHDNLTAVDIPSENQQFSFAHEDLRCYIKKFEKDVCKERLPAERTSTTRTNFTARDYGQKTAAESLLYEKVILKNRIESGGLLLCDVRTF